MREFWRDYSKYQQDATNLCKVWYKKHWKGTVLFNVLILVVVYGWIFRDDIKDGIKSKFNKKKEIETL